MEKVSRLVHGIPAIYNERSRILILGSFPSVKSREAAFFYGHPQNRFWRVLAAVFGTPLPLTVEEKTALLLEYRVALWDVVAECEIVGSSDSSLKALRLNDISPILAAADIGAVLINGKKAHALFIKGGEIPACPVLSMPSTSPANAAVNLEALVDIWGEAIRRHL